MRISLRQKCWRSCARSRSCYALRIGSAPAIDDDARPSRSSLHHRSSFHYHRCSVLRRFDPGHETNAILSQRRKVFADLGAPYAGVSDPPRRWHSGPGRKLKRGDTVWFVVAREWPRCAVENGRYVWPAKDVAEAAQLETHDGRNEAVAFARIFTSRQDAEREAEVLENFGARAWRCGSRRRR
jgi:hypothetical protein